MYKKVCCTCKVVFMLIGPTNFLAILLLSSLSITQVNYRYLRELRFKP